MSAVYIEFTEYYYPDGKDFPSKRVSCFVIICPLLGKLYFSCQVFEFYKCEKRNRSPFSLLFSLCVVYNPFMAFLDILICSYVLFPH